jgi:hypothetical protein
MNIGSTSPDLEEFPLMAAGPAERLYVAERLLLFIAVA